MHAPGVFVKWWLAFLGVVLVSFLCLLAALLCVFLFRFVYGYVGCGLVMVWYCVGNCFAFVKCVHILRWVDKVALFVFVNSGSYVGRGLRFCFLCVIIVSFCFCDLGYILY